MLEALDLSGQRGSTRLFTGLSFRVDTGTALVVTGPNGTGKTTLLRILAGLTAPASGEVRWRGTRIEPFAQSVRNAVVYAGHLPALKDELSAEENLTALAALAEVPCTTDQIQEALGEVTLARQRSLGARVLSAGQRRRIGLARLRLVRRPLWVLDEPATALDAPGVAMLASLVRRHLEAGGIAVAATHLPLGLDPSRVQSLVLGN